MSEIRQEDRSSILFSIIKMVFLYDLNVTMSTCRNWDAADGSAKSLWFITFVSRASKTRSTRRTKLLVESGGVRSDNCWFIAVLEAQCVEFLGIRLYWKNAGCYCFPEILGVCRNGKYILDLDENNYERTTCEWVSSGVFRSFMNTFLASNTDFWRGIQKRTILLKVQVF